MKEVKLSVSIISLSERPLDTIYRAARQCYFSGSVASDMGEVSREKMTDLIQRCIHSGHTSVLEHASCTFAISGVSRALSHQLVRHRIASYAQQSQRYVKVEDFEYVLPPSLGDETSAARAFFISSLERAAHSYQSILSAGVPAEDARFVLPSAAATNVVATMNCRALLHFIEQRCCNRAQWEIRSLAWSMRHELVGVLPEVFETSGPKCWRIGYCPEDEVCGFFAARGK